MFTLNHFILLGSSIAIIVAFILVQKKYNFSYETNLKALFCVGIVSELVKIMCNMVVNLNKSAILTTTDKSTVIL